MADDWFRSGAWDEEAKAEFEGRLKRARHSSRSQYLRIKGLSLQEAGETHGAHELWTRVLTEYPDSLDAGSAREHLADLARRTGEMDTAEAHYRTLLTERPSLNGTSGLAELSLAELLIERPGQQGYDEAGHLLNALHDREGDNGSLLFNASRFRFSVASAVLAARTGDLDAQQEAATAALGVLGQGPQFSRHPTVGLVVADEITIRWLESAAGGDKVRAEVAEPPLGPR